jgi:hypothetical protein
VNSTGKRRGALVLAIGISYGISAPPAAADAESAGTPVCAATPIPTGNCADSAALEHVGRPFFSGAPSFEAHLIPDAGHTLNLARDGTRGLPRHP